VPPVTTRAPLAVVVDVVGSVNLISLFAVNEPVSNVELILATVKFPLLIVLPIGVPG